MTEQPVLRLAVLGGILFGSACGCPPADAPATPRETVRAGMPAIETSPVDTLEGVVAELAPAGHYTYLRVGEPGDWAVVMGKIDLRLGDTVSLTVQGHKADFHSRRLDRSFETLFFASVPKG